MCRTLGLASVLCSIALICLGCTTLPTGYRQQVRDRLTAQMQSLEDRGFSGQILVAKGNTILLDSSYGFADLAKTTRVTPRTRFDVASVTKSFTAAAILKLRDAHKLSLSTPLSELFAEVPSDKARVSVYQLLSHTSGLSDNYPAAGVTDRREAIRRILDQPLAAVTGAAFHYSDDNYVLLAAAIEARSGETFEAFLRNQLFVPALMTQTAFWGQLNFGDPLQLAALQHTLPQAILRRQWGEVGPGGVLSTASDLYRWWRALAEGSVLPRQSVLDLLAVRERLQGGTGVALGWFRSPSRFPGEAIWSRGNEDWGHNAILYAIPSSGYVIAVTSNSGSVSDEPWSRRVRDEIERVLADTEFRAADRPANTRLDPTRLSVTPPGRAGQRMS